VKSTIINKTNNSRKCPVGIRNESNSLNNRDIIKLLLLYCKKPLKTDIPLIIAFVLAFPNQINARAKIS
jgi:hypothetical protein